MAPKNWINVHKSAETGLKAIGTPINNSLKSVKRYAKYPKGYLKLSKKEFDHKFSRHDRAEMKKSIKAVGMITAAYSVVGLVWLCIHKNNK